MHFASLFRWADQTHESTHKKITIEGERNKMKNLCVVYIYLWYCHGFSSIFYNWGSNPRHTNTNSSSGSSNNNNKRLVAYQGIGFVCKRQRHCRCVRVQETSLCHTGFVWMSDGTIFLRIVAGLPRLLHCGSIQQQFSQFFFAPLSPSFRFSFLLHSFENSICIR